MMTVAPGRCAYKLSILKSADAAGSACLRQTFEYAEPLSGIGHFIHTYKTDGNPLPTFAGEPEQIEIPEDGSAFGTLLWEHLDARYKIALFVRYINLESGAAETHVFNKHQR